MLDPLGQFILRKRYSATKIVLTIVMVGAAVTHFGQTTPDFRCLSDDAAYLWFKENDKQGFVDRSGKLVIPPIFDSASSFSSGRSVAQIGKLWGIIDAKGRWVVNPTYERVSDTWGKRIQVFRDQRYFFINRNGERMSDGFIRASEFHEDLAGVEIGGKWGYISMDGVFVIAPEYDYAGPFSGGIARVVKDERKFFINPLNQKVLEIRDEISVTGDFSEGLAPVRVDDLYGFIDMDGKLVIKPQFQSVGGFSEGMASVYIHGMFGFINRSGELVVKPKYDKVEEFVGGTAVVRVGDSTSGKYGFLDKNGIEIVPLKYDWADNYSCGIAYVEIDRKWGYIDEKGNFLFPPRGLKR